MREPWTEEDKDGGVTFAQVRTVRRLFVGVIAKIFLYNYRIHHEESHLLISMLLCYYIR